MAGEHGQGTCTIEVLGRGSAYVVAGETLPEANAVKLVFTVGASGIIGGATAEEAGQVVFRFPAGAFDATSADDYWAWEDSKVSIEVRDASQQLLTENTHYKVLKQDDCRVRVFPLTGYSFAQNYTVTLKIWGRTVRQASKFYTYHNPGKLTLQVESRRDNTVNSGITGGGENEFECLDAHIASMPGLEVRNADLDKLLVVAPLIVKWEGARSAEFDLAVVALDNYANACANPATTATVTLASDETWTCPDIDADDKTTRQFTFVSGDQGIKVLRRCRFTSRASNGQFAWINATSGSVGSIANPVDLSESDPAYTILVCDLHVHSVVDHRQNFIEPDATARYARDAARLDGILTTDHGWCWHTDSRWTPDQMYWRQRKAALAYTGDKFFVFQGWEWTRGQSSSGCATTDGPMHHNIICFPIQIGHYPRGLDCRNQRTEGKLEEKMNSLGHDYLMIGHPMHGQKDFSAEGAPGAHETVGEIISYKGPKHHETEDVTANTFVPFSWPRCFEVAGFHSGGIKYKHTYRYAWGKRDNQKKKLAVIGSSDEHTGHPGAPNWPGWGVKGSTTHYYKRGGLAFVMATAKDSCGCFRGLQQKRTYTSSGVRFFVDFQVRARVSSPQGAWGSYHMQGKTMSLAANTYDFEIMLRVAGCENLRQAKVYRYDPANQTAGDHGDGYVTVYSNTSIGAKYLDTSFIVSSVPVDGTTNDYFLFYLFAQQQEGTDTDLTDGVTYKWTASAGGTNEYYCELIGGGDPSLVDPIGGVFLNGVPAPKAALGSLPAGSYGYGDNDTLGYSTVYVQLSDGADPDAKGSGFVKHLSYGGNAAWASPVFVEVAS